MFAAVTCADAAVLMRIAREFSPRIESWSGGQELVLDLAGLARLFGEPQAIAEEIRRTAAAGAVQVRVAIAATRAAARLLVRHRAGVTVVAPGGDAEAIALAPVDLLVSLHAGGPGTNPREMDPGELVLTLKRWGLRTLGAFAALPSGDVAARLGQRGVRWQRVARGEDFEPLVPVVPEERFEQALELEWPIEGLEPLSFVLGRLLEPLSVQLERRDRGAARIHLALRLVTRETHARSLELPMPMREAKTLRTLLLLDLESHPPGAAIDRVAVTIDPTPGRVVQFSLLTRPLPSPEQVSTLMARLHALMGESRCGSPVIVDSWQPGVFEMAPFRPTEDDGQAAPRTDGTGMTAGMAGGTSGMTSVIADAMTNVMTNTMTNVMTNTMTNVMTNTMTNVMTNTARWDGDVTSLSESSRPVMALRRFRHPVIARVRVEHGKPSRVTTDRAGLAGGRVESCAGPWRTSGGWWDQGGAECGVRSAEEGSAAGDVRGAEYGVRLPSIARSATEGGYEGAEVRRGTDAEVQRFEGVAEEWGQRGAAAVLRSSGCGSVWQGANAVVRGFGGAASERRKESSTEAVPSPDAATGRTAPEVTAQPGDDVISKRRATVPWDRDEWDVTLSDGGTYRIFRERGPERWFVEGVVD